MESQNFSKILQNEGIPQSTVDIMQNEEYQEFDNAGELKDIFGQEGNYQDILQYLADGYSIEDLLKLGVREENIQMFLDYLRSNNLTVENAKAINQYSNGSNMILSLKRGMASKEDMKNGIISELQGRLKERQIDATDIEQIKTFVQELDYSKPLHENYQYSKQYLVEQGIPQIRNSGRPWV